ncbi:unnamed protein product [Amoebophrya sp. A120]|nr:unnamed protein product [Amoebophrya sp. A120]|eukprot:GSA120T00022332001.1
MKNKAVFFCFVNVKVNAQPLLREAPGHEIAPVETTSICRSLLRNFTIPK